MSQRFTSPALAAALLLMGWVAVAPAQYVGPGTVRPPTTIADVLREPIENQGVQLRGKLLQQLSVTKYLFTDGKQQIRVQITPELFPKVAVDERTEIMIVGRVESEFMQSPEIDVSSVELLGPPAPMAPDAVMPFTP